MGYNNELSGTVVLDLETVAAPSCADWLDPVKAPSNYKDPLKIAAYCEEKRTEIIGKAALEPDLCEIVALGIHDGGNLGAWTRDDASERDLIMLAWDAIQTRRIVGFNVLAFDLPVLIRRSQLLGILTHTLNLDRYRTPHCDLLERLSFNGRITMRSLAFYCRRFGIPVDDTIQGSDIAQLVADSDWSAVKAHVLSDVEKTAALARKLGWMPQAQPVEEAVI